MIAQGWGGAAGMAGNAEGQAAIDDAKNSWKMHENVGKNVNTGANVNATMDATINANTSILLI